MIASIAWKNIWRNKVRSMVVIVATVLGLVGGTFAGAFMLGMVDQRLRAAIDKEISHIQIHNPEYMENQEIQYSIPAGYSLAFSLTHTPGVKAVAPRSKILGMIASANSSSGIQLVAIEPEKEQHVTSIYTTICDSCGTYFGEQRKNQVLLSRKLADKLKVRLHSKVVIAFQDARGNLVEGAFRITGIYQTYNTMFDEENVFIRMHDLSDLLGQPAPVHEIAIIAKDPSHLGELTTRIRKGLPGLLVQDWSEVSPELGLLVGLTDQMMYIFLGIILLALAFGIVNTMLMAVLERTREIGMLLSIGMNKHKVFGMIMLETIWLTATGGLIGIVVSDLIIRFFHYKGISLSIISTGMEALGYESMVYPSITFSFYVVLSAMILVTAVLSSVYPALRALKIQPAEAIKLE